MKQVASVFFLVLTIMLCGCDNSASVQPQTKPQSAVFSSTPLPSDAVVDVELVQRQWGYEFVGLLSFTTRMSIDDIKETFNRGLKEVGWNYGKYRIHEEPVWEDKEGYFLRGNGLERLTVRFDEDELEQPAGAPRMVGVWYSNALPSDAAQHADYVQAASLWPDHLAYQYDIAQHLLETDPIAAAKIGERLSEREPEDYFFHLLVAQCLEKMDDVRKNEAIERYRKALDLLRYSGEVNLENSIRDQIEELSNQTESF